MKLSHIGQSSKRSESPPLNILKALFFLFNIAIKWKRREMLSFRIQGFDFVSWFLIHNSSFVIVSGFHADC